MSPTKDMAGDETVVVTPLGSPHHGDISELAITVRPHDTAQHLSLLVDGSEQGTIVVPAGASRASAILTGHLLPSGEPTVSVTRKVSGRDSVVAAAELEVPVPGGLFAEVARSLGKSRENLVVHGALDSTQWAYSDSALIPWFDRPDALGLLRARAAAGEVSEFQQTQLESFINEGFLILEGAVGDDEIRQAQASLDDIVATGFGGYTWGSSQRVEHAHLHYPAIERLTQIPAVLEFLRILFTVEAKVCQTLTYIFGSQQGSHQDTIHLTPFPAGYMCGVWIALENVRPGSGELGYYPGSHRLPRVYMDSVGCPKVTDGDWSRFGQTVVPRWESMLTDGGFQQERFLPPAGTVLIWHENLMHEGLPRQDPTLSRKSVVTHYFATGSIGFYDSSGMPARFWSGSSNLRLPIEH